MNTNQMLDLGDFLHYEWLLLFYSWQSFSVLLVHQYLADDKYATQLSKWGTTESGNQQNHFINPVGGSEIESIWYRNIFQQILLSLKGKSLSNRWADADEGKRGIE